MSFTTCFPDGLVLKSSRVRLRALTADDLSALTPLTAAKEIWTYFTQDLSQPGALQQWVDEAIASRRAQVRFPFAIVDNESGSICGSTSFGNISFFDQRLEIGWTWIGKPFMGTGINTHAKFLLLRYAFEELGFKRVEIKTDNLNERAKKALVKIGATPEGVLRSHMLMFNDRRRDSVYFSILADEWPDVRRNHFNGME